MICSKCGKECNAENMSGITGHRYSLCCNAKAIHEEECQNKMKLNIDIGIEIVENLNGKDIVATIFYPNEGNVIKIKKGLNTVELSESIFHEIGHLIDWYISAGSQSDKKDIREEVANNIGETLRFKKKRKH